MNNLTHQPGLVPQGTYFISNPLIDFNKISFNTLSNHLNEIIRKGKDDKLSVKRVTILVNSEKLDSIKKDEAKKKSELVNSGKYKVCNKRHYNRNENWKIEKIQILNNYCSKLEPENVYMVTATCRFMSNSSADKLMGSFTKICSYIVTAEKKRGNYHLHFIVNTKIDAENLELKLKTLKRFKEKYAVDSEKMDSLEDAVSYIMKDMLSNETLMNFFPKQKRLKIESKKRVIAIPLKT
jgi:hypothetical protein